MKILNLNLSEKHKNSSQTLTIENSSLLNSLVNCMSMIGVVQSQEKYLAQSENDGSD